MDKSDLTKLQHYIDKKIKGTELQILGPRRIRKWAKKVDLILSDNKSTALEYKFLKKNINSYKKIPPSKMNGSGIKRFKLKKKNEFTKGKIFFESDLLSREYDLDILKNLEGNSAKAFFLHTGCRLEEVSNYKKGIANGITLMRTGFGSATYFSMIGNFNNGSPDGMFYVLPDEANSMYDLYSRCGGDEIIVFSNGKIKKTYLVYKNLKNFEKIYREIEKFDSKMIPIIKSEGGLKDLGKLFKALKIYEMI